MSFQTDPSAYKSNFERNDLDRYFTEQDAAVALASRIPAGVQHVWEPAAGRGDLARVIKDFGYDVFASDIEPSEYDTTIGPCEQASFIDVYQFRDGAKKIAANRELIVSATVPSFVGANWSNIDMIATNPPFAEKADAFVRRAVNSDVRCAAFLLRSDWKHGLRRLDLFEKPSYACEIVLTWRPRWDWWFRDKPEASPRFNYSWFCWDREHTGPATQVFAKRSKRKK